MSEKEIRLDELSRLGGVKLDDILIYLVNRRKELESE